MGDPTSGHLQNISRRLQLQYEIRAVYFHSRLLYRVHYVYSDVPQRPGLIGQKQSSLYVAVGSLYTDRRTKRQMCGAAREHISDESDIDVTVRTKTSSTDCDDDVDETTTWLRCAEQYCALPSSTSVHVDCVVPGVQVMPGVQAEERRRSRAATKTRADRTGVAAGVEGVPLCHTAARREIVIRRSTIIQSLSKYVRRHHALSISLPSFLCFNIRPFLQLCQVFQLNYIFTVILLLWLFQVETSSSRQEIEIRVWRLWELDSVTIKARL